MVLEKINIKEENNDEYKRNFKEKHGFYVCISQF